MTTFLREEVEATLRDPSAGGGAAVIDLKGDLATATESRLRRAYAQAIGPGAKEVRLHFGEVEHINSSGISVLIDLLRDCQEHSRRLSFSGLTPHYGKVFTFMGLTQYAPIVDESAGADRGGAAPVSAPLDRRSGPRRSAASPSSSSSSAERRRHDRRSGDQRPGDRVVGALMHHMRARALTPADLAAHLGISESDLLDLAWQQVPHGGEATAALAARFGVNGARLAAILAARPADGIAQRGE